MNSSGFVPFAKMNGIGNKIIVADMRGRAGEVTPEAAIALNSAPNMQFDQLMIIHDAKSDGTDAFIRILNSDGSEAGACGNGMRCVTQALAAETGKTSFTFQTKFGVLLAVEHDDGLIAIDMGEPKFGWQDIPLSEEFRDTRMIELEIGPHGAPVLHSPSVASMGNPHAVFWVDDDIWSYDLERFGPLLENHPIFPERANITLAQLTGKDHLTMRTWERGAGLTLACGSAACAVAVSANRTRRTGRDVRLTLPGGDLFIIWKDNNHVVMTGAAAWEFSGMMSPQTGEFQRDEQEPCENLS